MVNIEELTEDVEQNAKRIQREQEPLTIFIFIAGVALVIYMMAPNNTTQKPTKPQIEKATGEADTVYGQKIEGYIEVLAAGDQKCEESTKMQSFTGLSIQDCAAKCSTVEKCNIFNFVTTGSGYCALLSSNICTPVKVSNTTNKVVAAQKKIATSTPPENPTDTVSDPTGVGSGTNTDSKPAQNGEITNIKIAIGILVILLVILLFIYWRYQKQKTEYENYYTKYPTKSTKLKPKVKK